jgi:hypothetical protein
MGPPRVSDSQGGPDPLTPGRQSQQVVAAGDGLGDRARKRHVERVGDGLHAAEVDRESPVLVSIAVGLPVPERRRDVERGQSALPLGVLGGHGGDLSRSAGVRHGGYVARGVDVAVAGHPEALVDHHAPLPGRHTHGLHQRIGAHPHAPHDRSGRDVRTVAEHGAGVGDLADRRPEPHVDAPATEHPHRRGGQVGVEPRQHAGGEIEQHPARRTG